MRTRCQFRRTEIMEIDLTLMPGVVKADIIGHINVNFGGLVFRQDVIPEGSDYRPTFHTSTWDLVSTADPVADAIEAAPGATMRLTNSAAHLALASEITGPTQVCGHCGGLGKSHEHAYHACSYCNGAGHVRTGKDEELSPGADCPDCGMTGMVKETIGAGAKARTVEHKCQRCRGKGRIPESGDLLYAPELPPALAVGQLAPEYRRMLGGTSTAPAEAQRGIAGPAQSDPLSRGTPAKPGFCIIHGARLSMCDINCRGEVAGPSPGANIKCDTCLGTGSLTSRRGLEVDCPVCDGRGVME